MVECWQPCTPTDNDDDGDSDDNSDDDNDEDDDDRDEDDDDDADEEDDNINDNGEINRGYYTVARRYEFYVRVARTKSHEWAKRTSETLFLPLEHKIHIFEPTCNVLFIIWRNQFNKSRRQESWRHWTIRYSQRWHTEYTPLRSRMKWRMESLSGLVPSKTLSSI